MSGFLGGGSRKTTVTEYSGLQVQSTSSALPIPIGYGRNVIAPNVIWYNDFNAKGNSSKAGGKGGSSRATSYTYSCSIIMALGEGAISGIGNVWDASPTPVTLATTGLTLYEGAAGQAVWSYLTTAHSDQALAYPGTAYLCASNYNLGSSASVSTNTFEVYWPLAGTGCNGVDADPALIIQDFLTNSQYGCGFPSSSINAGSLLGGTGTSAYQCYCFAAGIAISPVLNMQEKATSILARWLQLTNSTAVWSGGLLNIIPLGDMNIAANSHSWLANDTPLYDLTDDDFLHTDGEDPIQINRSDAYSAYNRQSVEVQARSDNYNSGPVEVFDQASIDRFGSRIGSTVTAHEICDLAVANVAAQLILQRGLYVRNTYSFKLSLEFCHLDPMDLVTLTDPLLGLAQTAVRITDIEEDDSGYLTVTAEEFPQGVATATRYAVQSKIGTAPNNQVAPGSINAPIIFEPPGQLAGALQVWAIVTGSDPNWGGAHVWASYDGTTYSQVGQVTAGAKQGLTTSALASVSTSSTGPTIDSANTLSVSLAESGGSLLSTSVSGAQNGATLCYVGGELLAYENASLTGTNAYNLSYLVRGLYGTQASVGAHASGVAFAQIDNTVFKYTYANPAIGQTIHLKFTSFNIYGAAEEDPSTVAVYTHTLSGAPTPSAVTILTAAITQSVGGVSLTLDATWTTDPLAVTYIAQISADSGTTFRTIYDAAQTALSVTGLGQQSLVLRVAGVSSNSVAGPWATIGVTSPIINYAGTLTQAYITYDQLASPAALAFSLAQIDTLDDALISATANALAQNAQTNAVSASAGAAQAGVTQAMTAIATANSALASYNTVVQASLDANSASITTLSQSIATATSAQATQIASLTAATAAGRGYGNLVVQAASSYSGVSASIQLGVSTSGGGASPVYAGMYLLAMSDGTSRVVVNASNFYVLNSSTQTVVFGTNTDGSLTLNGVTNVSTTIKSTTTTDGTQPVMTLDFVNGVISIWDTT